jgi:HEAT repeat protein/beta-lactamase regulating signal transducer with metallopeptidase domain
MTTTLLVILLKVTLVLLIAMGLTRAMPRAAARARHLVWLLAVGALVVVPAVSTWAPIEVPVLVRADRTDRAVETDKAVEAGKLAEPAVPSLPSVLSAPPALSAPVLLALAWLVIAAALLVRLLAGALAVRRIVRRARPLDDSAWLTPLYEIADRMGLEQAPRLLQSSDVQMPFAAGLTAPAVVLPLESESWSAERRSAVLVHELGHVRRRDLIGHTLSRIVCAAYWFHPLVWTAARRLRAESEQACDDLALAYGARPSDYAEHLLDIVVCVRQHRIPSVALAMAHKREFEGRMLAILNPDRRRQGPGRLRMASFAGALAGVVLLVGAVKPVEKASTVNGQRSFVGDHQLAVDAGRGTPDSQAFEVLTPDSQSSNRPAPEAQPAPHPAPDARAFQDARTNMNISTQVSARINLSEIINQALGGHATALPGDTAVVRALMERLKDEDADVREAAAQALGRIANPMAIPELVKALDDPQPRVQEAALDALSEFERGVPEAPVQRMLASTDADMRQRAVQILMSMRARGALPAITALVSDAEAGVRQSAIQAIQEMGNPSAASAVMPALGDRDADVRQAGVQALMQLGGTIPDAALDKLLQDSDADVRQATVQYIGERRVTTKTTQLIRLLDDPSGDVREAAAEALTEARTPESHAALRRALTNADADVRRIAVEYFGEGDDQ